MGDHVNAAPTKRLVAYVLTKDIQLEDAVLDLLDNSIDGAKRSKNDKLTGFEVKIHLSANEFKIEDNCGGIPYETARDYAFRFGRAEDYAPLDGSAGRDVVGNFGVGMKRALLKMGRSILIKSLTRERYFEISIDVERWLADDKTWSFEFSNVRTPKPTDAGRPGTSITVTKLYEGVAARFQLDEFETALRNAITEKQAVPLAHGMAVVLNSELIVGAHLRLMQSSDLKPFRRDETLTDAKGEVKLNVYAGVDQPDNDRAGWYVICNGRTVLRADQSQLTGWGHSADKIPNYHHQYARFRGFVLFTSTNPELLPWNTSKSSVDPEHPYYRKALQLMIMSMQQVFTFLKDVDRESISPDQPLTDALAKMKPQLLEKINVSEQFVVKVKAKAPPPGEALKFIKYSRPEKEVKKVMDALGVSKPNEVGEQTFDLYYEANVRE